MTLVEEILIKTEQLLHCLQNEEDRERKIDKVDQLLAERQQLMDQLKPPYSAEEKELGQQINKLNQKVSNLLNKEKLLIQQDIKGINQKKESSSKYSNPYESLNTDGVFYDKRN